MDKEILRVLESVGTIDRTEHCLKFDLFEVDILCRELQVLIDTHKSKARVIDEEGIRVFLDDVFDRYSDKPTVDSPNITISYRADKPMNPREYLAKAIRKFVEKG